ncbi:MAG TPA: 50S ribosomal protein L9 [Candidatus Omnitrophica bacterium]|nr:50S ribosomal protein L9 [Candidatus Omnitrophota bacterium]
MEVILLKDEEKLGKLGDVVNVKKGYARNYLIPQNLAVEATPANRRIVEREKLRMEKKREEEKHQAEELAKKLENVSLTIPVHVGEDDKLYGSVTSQDIANFLKEEGFTIDKKKIQLESPLKALGIYNINIKLHPEVTATIRVWVVKM